MRDLVDLTLCGCWAYDERQGNDKWQN